MSNIEKELNDALDIMSDTWHMQNNRTDAQTNFIYSVTSLQECLNKINAVGADQNDTLHRWYNFHTSTSCEYLFCDYGAVHNPNKYDHSWDISINGVRYDVKLTVYPDALSHKPYDLTTEQGRTNMIQWLYNSQSQGNRKQMLNRIYIVCDAGSAVNNNRMKSNLTLIRQKVKEYMYNIDVNNQRRQIIVDTKDNDREYDLGCDLIYVH